MGTLLLATAASATSPDHHNKMASILPIIVLLCGLYIGASVAQEDRVCTCPAGWSRFGDSCYIHQGARRRWADAERACTRIGGNLASIQPKGVYGFLRKLIKTKTRKNKTTWVGGHDAVKEGVWMWSDGSKFAFKGWHKGEPNNFRNREDCMEMNFRGRDFVNDSNCRGRRPYVCAMLL